MMLDMFGDVLLLLAGIGTTIAIFFFIERKWPAGTRLQHNELIGWQINILGTVYAIILGFMLYTTWNSFQAAKQNAGAEATALVNVARLGRGLPQDQGTALWSMTTQYAEVVIDKEWPAMQQSRFVPETQALIDSMWKQLTSVHPQNLTQQIALSQALSEMSVLADHRRMRMIELTDRLPGILWLVLDSGGALLLLCCCLFGSHHIRLHLFLVATLSFLLTLLLLTIAGVDRPFQGWMHVPVDAFRGAASTLKSD